MPGDLLLWRPGQKGEILTKISQHLCLYHAGVLAEKGTELQQAQQKIRNLIAEVEALKNQNVKHVVEAEAQNQKHVAEVQELKLQNVKHVVEA